MNHGATRSTQQAPRDRLETLNSYMLCSSVPVVSDISTQRKKFQYCAAKREALALSPVVSV